MALAALATIIGGILTVFNAGDIVPYLGPALQGGLAIFTLIMGVVSLFSHNKKNNELIAAGG